MKIKYLKYIILIVFAVVTIYIKGKMDSSNNAETKALYIVDESLPSKSN